MILKLKIFVLNLRVQTLRSDKNGNLKMLCYFGLIKKKKKKSSDYTNLSTSKTQKRVDM